MATMTDVPTPERAQGADAPRNGLLRAWVLSRLPVPLALLVLIPGALGGLIAAVLTRVPYAHGTAKALLAPWMMVIYRQVNLPCAVAFGVTAALVLGRLSGRRWAVGAA